MAIDHRIGTKINKNLRREDVAATRVDPHPYIGIVKNNVDPAKSGRLQVWIPDFGGNPLEPQNWRTVSYASPFMGSTHVATTSADNTFTNVPHTYGMWMVPPDLEVEVIVIFIAGDPLKGFWLACINSHLSRFMMPGLASSSDTITGINAPVTEFNEQSIDKLKNPDFTRTNKPIHEPQYNILKEQGLDRDTSRGTITSSSQRESPSNVFGISTPGRPYYANPSNDPAVNPDAYLANLASGKLTENDYKHSARVGGHTFVMDDGNILGNDQLVRLRTAGGHQLMMNDTDNTLYISHKNGTSWIELTSDGSVNIFANNGFNVRSKGTINLHSDKDVNINAENNLTMRSGSATQIDAGTLKLTSLNKLSIFSRLDTEFKSSAFNVDSSTSISLLTSGKLVLNGSAVPINSVAGTIVVPVNPVKIQTLHDTSRSSGVYTSESGKLSTIATVAPTHEPFNRIVAETVAIVLEAKSSTTHAYKVRDAGATAPTVPDRNLREIVSAPGGMGILSQDQVTAYMAQLALSESNAPTPMSAVCKVPAGLQLQNGKAGYSARNQCGFLGKYQMGAGALIDAGLVKSDANQTKNLGNPNVWLNGMTMEEFLYGPNASAIQEKAIYDYTFKHYRSLVNSGVIDNATTPGEAAGMLMVAHLTGVGGAIQYDRDKTGGDINNGTTSASYFDKGRKAIDVTAVKLAALKAADAPKA